MPKRFSSDEVTKSLKRNGFVLISQKGSHIKFRLNDKTVIVPAGRKQIPAGTFQSILRQSGLTLHAFN